ncbi:glycosyltransferase family 2 protein [Futiania mangrovi]|uniref:Glycosyltransferase n=1 Tax=Futiania mangrovi TaxID=2959716 RepID=A0A9J6PFB6_9PROT|nr:glycosyltransferase [Futiania mangrovii]MCP1337409.1 glycosyltransferase [Futiania mangrovii]
MTSGTGDPRVSIIMPVFNAAPFIAESIGSALGQTFPDVELIVLDDGSTDGSQEAVQSLADDPRVRIVRSGSSEGPFVLRNRGIGMARGSLIAFLDADDCWHPDKLKRQVAALEAHPEAGLCHTLVQDITEDGKPIPERLIDMSDFQGDCFRQMLRRNGVGNSSVVVPKQVFEVVGCFDESFRYRGDWEMWVRIAHRFPLIYLNEPLTFYRLHASNVSWNHERLRPYALAVVRKFARDYGSEGRDISSEIEETLTDTYRSFGTAAMVARDFPQARRDLWTALKRRPADAGTLLSLAKAYVYPLVGKT